jgi:hypothetical protein
MNKFWGLFLLIITLSSCTKKNDIIVENAHNDGIIEEVMTETFLIEGSEKISDENSLNKMDKDIAMWNRFIGGDLENIKYENVTPVNSLSLEDWKQNNNESERIRIFFERFCGYYISVVDFGKVRIAKLSIGGHLDRYLVLQTISLTDDGFVEGNKFLLDDIDVDDVFNYISFRPSDGYYHYLLTYIPKNLYNRKSDQIDINIKVNDYVDYGRFNSSINFFARNHDEIKAIIESIFSIEIRKKFIGRFVFQGYEYFKSYNRDDNIIKEEIEQRIIEVDIDENGYLFVSGIRNDPSLIDNTIRNLFIRDNSQIIFNSAGVGGFSSWDRLFYFLNENTIINEYNHFRGGDDGEIYSSLDYKVIYIKTNEIFE